MAKQKVDKLDFNQMISSMATAVPAPNFTPVGNAIMAPRGGVELAPMPRATVAPLNQGYRMPQGEIDRGPMIMAPAGAVQYAPMPTPTPKDQVVPSVMAPAQNRAQAFEDILKMMSPGQSQVTIPYQAGQRPANYDENLAAFVEQNKQAQQSYEQAKAKGELRPEAYLNEVPRNEKIVSTVPLDTIGASTQPVSGELTVGAVEFPSTKLLSAMPRQPAQEQIPQSAGSMNDILAALAINLIPAFVGNLVDPGAGYNPAIGAGLAGTQFLIGGRLDEERARREKEAELAKLEAETKRDQAKMEFDYKKALDIKKLEKNLEGDKVETTMFQYFNPNTNDWRWGIKPKKMDPNIPAEEQMQFTMAIVKPSQDEKSKNVPRLIFDHDTGYYRWENPPEDLKPGESRIAGGKQRTATAPKSGQSGVQQNIPKLAPKHRNVVLSSRDKFQKEISANRDAMKAGERIVEILSSPLGVAGVPVEMAKLMGDKGVLSNQDVSRWGGSPALLSKIETLRSQLMDGTLSDENQELFKEMAIILSKKHSEVINERMNAYIDSDASALKIDRRAVEQVYAPFAPKSSLSGEGSKTAPTTRAEKEKRAMELLRNKGIIK